MSVITAQAHYEEGRRVSGRQDEENCRTEQTADDEKGQRTQDSVTHNHKTAGLEVCCYKAAGKSIKKIKWESADALMEGYIKTEMVEGMSSSHTTHFLISRSLEFFVISCEVFKQRFREASLVHSSEITLTSLLFRQLGQGGS